MNITLYKNFKLFYLKVAPLIINSCRIFAFILLVCLAIPFRNYLRNDEKSLLSQFLYNIKQSNYISLVCFCVFYKSCKWKERKPQYLNLLLFSIYRKSLNLCFKTCVIKIFKKLNKWIEMFVELCFEKQFKNVLKSKKRINYLFFIFFEKCQL